VRAACPFGPEFKKKRPRSGPFGPLVNGASDRLRRQRCWTSESVAVHGSCGGL